MAGLNALFDRLLWGLAVFSAAIIAAITLAIPINVALRNLGLPVIYGTLDAIEYGLLVATFLAAPWVLAINAHVQVDLVTRALPDRGRRAASVLACGIGALAAAVLCWYATEAMVISQARGSMIRTAFTIPEWCTLTVVPVSMALCMIEFIRKIFGKQADDAPLSGL